MNFKLQQFNCPINLWDYFKVAEYQKATNGEEQIFKSQPKEK